MQQARAAGNLFSRCDGDFSCRWCCVCIPWQRSAIVLEGQDVIIPWVRIPTLLTPTNQLEICELLLPDAKALQLGSAQEVIQGFEDTIVSTEPVCTLRTPWRKACARPLCGRHVLEDANYRQLKTFCHLYLDELTFTQFGQPGVPAQHWYGSLTSLDDLGAGFCVNVGRTGREEARSDLALMQWLACPHSSLFACRSTCFFTRP